MTKITPSKVKASFTDLKEFAVKTAKDTLYLIQLSGAYTFFDGWDIEDLIKDGLILKKATFTRRCNGHATKLEHFNERCGFSVRTEPKRIMSIAPYIPGKNNKASLSEMYKTATTDKIYDSFHMSKRLKEQPFLFRQLFMETVEQNKDGMGDIYIWTRTAVPSAETGNFESRMILTHVNAQSIGEIFRKKKIKSLQNRILVTAKRVSQKRYCEITKIAPEEQHEQIVCNNRAD